MTHRVILHHALTPHTGKGPISRMVSVYSAGSTPAELSAMIDRAVESGFATGGHIEHDVRGIGWCIWDEPEPCESDADPGL